MHKFGRLLVWASLSWATLALAQTTTAPAPSAPAAWVRRPVSTPNGPTRRRAVSDWPIPTLVFDSETKTYDAKAGEAQAPFVFNLTNVWTNAVIIERTQTSCGCTVAKLPEQPWHLKPGANGQIKVTLALGGKPPGLVEKTITLFTSVGERVLTVQVNNPPPMAMTQAQRKANAAKASKDRQCIFRVVDGVNCAECHVQKGLGQMGAGLYAADCGICHDSPNRASGVPDLKAVAAVRDTGFDYWKEWISDGGRAGSMMPAFAKSHGGPLDEPEINSIAAYLTHFVSRHPE